MKVFIYLTIIFLFNYSYLIGQSDADTAEIEIVISVADNLGGTNPLTFGLDSLALSGLDQFENELAPPPPIGVWEARFVSRAGQSQLGQGSFKDIRTATGGLPFTGTYIHQVKVQVSEFATQYTITWGQLPAGIVPPSRIVDLFGGVLLNVPLNPTGGSATVTNLGISEFLIEVYYSNIIPVELSFFSASIINDYVALTWRTETELNNYGFEIERRTLFSEWQTIGFVKGNGTTANPSEYSYADKSELLFKTYQYRLKQLDLNGSFEYSNLIEVDFSGINNYTLNQNYPNPFNPSTTISFKLPISAYVTLSIYNSIGEKVDELVNQNLSGGIYNIVWNADQFTSGVYFYELRTDQFVSIKKMQLIK